MPPAANLDAHKPYLDIWQRALESPQGIRVNTPNPVDLRARLYHARAADRRNAMKIYPEGHAMRGRSYYDEFAIYLERDAIRIVPSTIEIAGVEEL